MTKLTQRRSKGDLPYLTATNTNTTAPDPSLGSEGTVETLPPTDQKRLEDSKVKKEKEKERKKDKTGSKESGNGGGTASGDGRAHLRKKHHSVPDRDCTVM